VTAYIHQHSKAEINQSDDIKLLHTKNSTNDDGDYFAGTSQLLRDSYESTNFKIKRGLSKFKKSCAESNLNKNEKASDVEAPSSFSLVNSSTFEHVAGFKNFMGNLNSCTRFMSEFVINDLKKGNYSDSKLSENHKDYSGKLEFNWTNVIDKKTYTVTIVDPLVYKGNFMNQVYALSAIRDGNPYICKYFSSWREQGFIFVQTEKWDETVAPMILNCKLDAENIVKLIKQVLCAIEYCHQKGLNNLEVSLNSIFISETGHFKLKWFEGCELYRNAETSCDLNDLTESKAEDMDKFCTLVEELLSNKFVAQEIKKHSSSKKALQLLVTNNIVFTEFDILS
jgi:hypothetical protein